MMALFLPSDKSYLLYSEEVLQNEAEECSEAFFFNLHGALAFIWESGDIFFSEVA